MNRREALGALLGAAVSFILPAPRRRIDLMQFCGREGYGSPKYDFTLPWELADFVYATDARACVRVRPESADRKQREGKMPPFGDLAWDHDRLRGWRELPKLTPLLARDSCCPACDGTGFDGGKIGHDCETCDGMGQEWVGSNYDISCPIKCRTCNGRGVFSPVGAADCPHCHGKSIGTFPSVVCLHGHYFNAALYERVRQLGTEYVLGDPPAVARFDRKDDARLMSFRFDGAEGLLLGMDRNGVSKRLVTNE